MKPTAIDETKLASVMELLEKAGALMAEKDCENDKDAKKELTALQRQLRELCGSQKLKIRDFRRYWAYTDLETIARRALMAPPAKTGLTDTQLRELVTNIMSFRGAELDWWLEHLKLNTGLDNLTDYIFYPDFFGLSRQAGLDEIAEKIIADRKALPGAAQGDAEA